jgi:hypothetical protein
MNSILFNISILFNNFISYIFNVYYKFYSKKNDFIIPKYIQDTKSYSHDTTINYFLDRYQYQIYTIPDIEMGFSPLVENISYTISPTTIKNNKLRIRIPNYYSSFQYIK